jgi:hypothetical protein
MTSSTTGFSKCLIFDQCHGAQQFHILDRHFPPQRSSPANVQSEASKNLPYRMMITVASSKPPAKVRGFIDHQGIVRDGLLSPRGIFPEITTAVFLIDIYKSSQAVILHYLQYLYCDRGKMKACQNARAPHPGSCTSSPVQYHRDLRMPIAPLVPSSPVSELNGCFLKFLSLASSYAFCHGYP